MKIIVIGAGHGGLHAAKILGENGNDVLVLEAQSRASLGYDWCDDVEPTVFKELGIPLPEGSCRPDALSFVAPFSSKPLFVYSKEESREYHIDRRDFLKILVERAEKTGVKIEFDTRAERLIIENGKVCGVTVNDTSYYCDLVIDSSGMSSPFRGQIPNGNITERLQENEYFSVYRGFYSKNENEPMPEKHRKKLYLKHLGEKGISWCICEKNEQINVLIGRVGKMSDETFANAMKCLREDNKIIGDTLVRGGQFCTIPIRYPLTRMVSDGYAAIGDSAFMTIPLIGSGIANSLRAGQILGDLISKSNSTSVEALWEYQKEYYKKIGAEHFMVDSLKRMLLDADSEDIKYLFESGILTDEDMMAISLGEGLKLSASSILNKIVKIAKKPRFVGNLISAVVRGLSAQKCAKAIPERFDDEKIIKWQKKCEGYFNKIQKE